MKGKSSGCWSHCKYLRLFQLSLREVIHWRIPPINVENVSLKSAPSPLSLDEWTFLRFVRWHLILPLCLSTFPYNCSNDNWNHDTCLFSVIEKTGLSMILSLSGSHDRCHTFFHCRCVNSSNCDFFGQWRLETYVSSEFILLCLRTNGFFLNLCN